MANTLQSGQKLTPGQKLQSPDGAWELVYQTDGNLALYNRGSYVWDANAGGNPPGEAVMQTDGHFVLYRPGGVYYWGTGVYGFNDGRLVLANGGQLAVIRGANTVVWQGLLSTMFSVLPAEGAARACADSSLGAGASVFVVVAVVASMLYYIVKSVRALSDDSFEWVEPDIGMVPENLRF